MAGKLGLFHSYQQDLERARLAHDQRRTDDGLAILAPYKELLSIDIDFMLVYSRLFRAKGQIAEAEEILSRLLAIDPSHSHATRECAECLVALDRRPEALALLEAAHRAEPGDNGILGSYLALLFSERDLAAAMTALRKEHLRRTPPRKLEPAVEKLRHKVLALYEPADLKRIDPDNLLQLDGAAETQGYSLRHIYEAFETIGCNCEFGFVQRQSGAEPLSLLRWTAITPENLLKLLACDLDGYDEPDHYSLHGNFEREFLLYEPVFETRSHTGVNQGDIPAAEFLHRVTRRQGFLKRKFLADAAEGRKIFVYKSDAPLSEEQMTGIEAELVRLGVGRCLFVMPTTDPRIAGKVKAVSPIRLVGFLSSVMPDIRYDEWNRIVVAIYDTYLRGGGAE